MRSMINKRHLEKENFGKRVIDAFSDFFDFSGKEIICTMFLVASLTFLSTFIPLGQEIIQPPSLTDLPIIIERFGFPFESLEKVLSFSFGERAFQGKIFPVMNVDETVEFIWFGLVMNFILYALVSFVIVRAIARVREEIYYYRYDKR